MKRYIIFLLTSFITHDSFAQKNNPLQQPNVLIIIADDQGWGDLGFTGNKTVHTPHLDKLAKSGTILDRFYVSPVCSPTRAEILTGRYHVRTGVSGTSTEGFDWIWMKQQSLKHLKQMDTKQLCSENGITVDKHLITRTAEVSMSSMDFAQDTGGIISIPFSNTTVKSSKEKDS